MNPRNFLNLMGFSSLQHAAMIPQAIKEKLEEDYQSFGSMVQINELNHGSNGSVYRVQFESHTLCVKSIRKDNPSAHNDSEISAIVYDNLLKVKQYEDSTYLYFTMPFFNGVSLENIIAKSNIAAGVRLKIFEGLMSQVDLIHQKGVLHRDLKSSNIIVDIGNANEVHVIDFGRASRIFDHTTGKPLANLETLSLISTNWFSSYSTWLATLTYPFIQLGRQWLQSQTAPEYTSIMSGYSYFYEQEIGLRSDYYSLAIIFKLLFRENEYQKMRALAQKIIETEGTDRTNHVILFNNMIKTAIPSLFDHSARLFHHQEENIEGIDFVSLEEDKTNIRYTM